MQRILVVVAFVFIGISLALFLWQQRVKQVDDDNSRALAAAANDSGNQFLVNGQPVRIEVDGVVRNFDVDDDLSITASLQAIALQDRGGLANETPGTLLPTLSVSGCQVDPANGIGISTRQPLAAFRWHWSAVCANPGEHDLSLRLSFLLDHGADPGTSDPTAYRWSTTVTSHDPLGRRLMSLVDFLSPLVALVTGVWALYEKMRPQKSATP
jgi:nitrogen fixation-related uncharacterized protein